MPKFIRNSRDQGLFICVDLDNQLINGSLEYTIDNLVENHLDLTELINDFLEISEKRTGKRNAEIKSNITDNESAKLTSSHGVVQGYTALAAVDSKHQVITCAHAAGSQNEGKYLRDIIEQSKELLSERITNETAVVADTAYFSEANCEYLFTNGQKGIIPDNHFRQRDSRFHRNPELKNRNPRRKKKGLFTQDDFTYDKNKNWYICPAGKNLRPEGRRNMHGHIGRRYLHKDGGCEFCHLKTQCLRKDAKKRSLFIVDIPKEMTFSKKMMKIIDSKEGRDIYSKRMGIVEPVFGNITRTKRLDRFNYRGQKKVNTIWNLYCMVHNIEKIHRYGRKE